MSKFHLRHPCFITFFYNELFYIICNIIIRNGWFLYLVRKLNILQSVTHI